MIAERNTAALWDRTWANPVSSAHNSLRLAKEERGVRWQRLEQIVLDRCGSFEDLNVIEIGAGMGTNAALMAERGAKVTVLDYSPKAIERAKQFFQGMGLPATFVLQDALALPEELLGQYEVSMSFGLAEHFLGPPRIRIIRAHLDLLRPGGLTFVSVPNKNNLPYRLHKWITERTGAWAVGEEYPFTRNELEEIARQLPIADYGFFGDCLWRSKRFLNPLKWFRRPKLRSGRAESAWPGTLPPLPRRRALRPERGTRWDAYYSYALVLWAVRDRDRSNGSDRT